MNHVVLLGNLAGEPEFKELKPPTDDEPGKAVCNFRLAVNRHGIDHTDFFTVVTWNRQAYLTKQFLTKGRQVLVEGRLHHSVWASDDGPRSRVEVIAQRVEWLGGPKIAQADRNEPPASDDFAGGGGGSGDFARDGGSDTAVILGEARSVDGALDAADGLNVGDELPSEPAYG
jgi:single-strand DNA-binding protein